MVAGASGGIGQPLSLLLKQNALVTHLALYDLAPVTPGVAADLSHIDTAPKVTGHKGPEQLADAIKGKRYINKNTNICLLHNITLKFSSSLMFDLILDDLT